jgi:hypothetical protein
MANSRSESCEAPLIKCLQLFRTRMLFHRRRETGFAQDCVVGLAGLELATKRL